MPIKSHTSFLEPESDAVLWRYMDLAKFASLITSKNLWLSNAEELAREDPHEALLPEMNFSHRNWKTQDDIPEKILDKIRRSSYGPHQDIEYKISREIENREIDVHYYYISRREYFVNCWHRSDCESAAMWKVYGSPGAGIAITTTTDRLKTSLLESKEDIFMGYVKYIDPKKDFLDTSNMFNSVLTKRNVFSYESEVRLVHWDGTLTDNMPLPIWHPQAGRFEVPKAWKSHETTPVSSGRGFKCNLGSLIEKVWISPYAPDWYAKTISELCIMAGLEVDIASSTLLNPAIS